MFNTLKKVIIKEMLLAVVNRNIVLLLQMLFTSEATFTDDGTNETSNTHIRNDQKYLEWSESS